MTDKQPPAYLVFKAREGCKLETVKLEAIAQTLETGLESIIIFGDRLYSVTLESLQAAVKPANPAQYMAAIEAVDRKLRKTGD